MIRTLIALTVVATGPVLMAEEAADTVEPVVGKPVIEKIDDERTRVGEIEINSRTREIRFPASINMTEGLLEFVIVHENGKIHESVLSTAVPPTHINLAFTLLRYKTSRELYFIPNESGAMDGDNFHQEPDDVRKAARISISVEWQDGDLTRKVGINEWVRHTVTATTMPGGPWVYGGSEFFQGRYAPEMSGDIAAIFLTNSAIINYPGKDNRDDTVWVVYPGRVPPLGTKVTVVIAPYQGPLDPPSP